MAAHFVSASFAVANPSVTDLLAIRAAQLDRVALEHHQAMSARRPEEVGMSGAMVDIGCYLVAHGFTVEPTEEECWFGMGPDAYCALAYAGTDTDASQAMFGGRWPLMACQPMRVAA